MVRLIDPPRLTESQVDIPENIRRLLRSAQRDAPSLSEIASLKQKISPLLNKPPAPSSIVGPLNGSIFGLGKVILVATLVTASGFTYWAVQNRLTADKTSSTIDGRENSYRPTRTRDDQDIDQLAPSMSSVPESTMSVLDLQPKPPRSKSQNRREITRSVHANPVKKEDVRNRSVTTAEPRPKVDPSNIAENTQKEMDEAELLSLARNALPTDPAQTLRLTFEHYKKFGKGVLSEEREVLIIEALLRLGRKDEARARTGNFLRVYPQSVYRRRLSRQVFSND